MLKIVTKVLMIGKSIYLRSVKRTNNLKKGELFDNTKQKNFTHLLEVNKKNVDFVYFDQTVF